MVYKNDLLEAIGDAAHRHANTCADITDANEAKTWAEVVRQLAGAYALIDGTDDDDEEEDDEEDDDA